MIPSDIRKALIHKWPLRLRNGQGTVLTPFMVLRVVSSTIVDGELVKTVALPNTTFLSEYVVNGPFALGTGSTDESLGSNLKAGGLVQYDTGNTPALGEGWGPQNAAGTIKKHRYGFRITGTATTVGSFSVVPAQQFDVVEFMIKNDTGSAIAVNSSGTFKIFTGTPGSEADTGLTVTAYNKTSVSFANGKFGSGGILHGEIYAVPWQT